MVALFTVKDGLEKPLILIIFEESERGSNLEVVFADETFVFEVKEVDEGVGVEVVEGAVESDDDFADVAGDVVSAGTCETSASEDEGDEGVGVEVIEAVEAGGGVTVVILFISFSSS